MYCTECGAKVPDEKDYCDSCGADLTALKRANAEIAANAESVAQSTEGSMEDIAAAAAAAAAEAEKNAFAEAGAVTENIDEFDPEGGTTVLTEDMSGPLTAEDAQALQQMAGQPVPPFGGQPAPQPAPQPQPQPQVQKVVTPAPVTNSTILNSDIQPIQQPQGGPYQQFQPQGAPAFGGSPAGPMNDDYKPISPLGYLGYSLLFCIPIVGLVFMFIYGFGDGNINRRNFARFYLIALCIGIVFFILMLIMSLVFGFALFGSLF